MRKRRAAGTAALAAMLATLLTACVMSPGNTAENARQKIEISEETAGTAPEQTQEATAQPETVQAQDESQEAQDTETGSSYHQGRKSYYWNWRNDKNKYTKTDYELIQSFHTADYGQKSVDEFNRMVMDWDNEEEYHRTEESFQRIFAALEEEDELYEFVFSTLSNTWDECDRKHYETCRLEKNPWHAGEAYYETYGDVFGDKVMLTGAYVNFSFDYKIPDEKAITVAQRDSLLDGVGREIQAFLEKQDAKNLQNEEAMEKTLDAELGRILQKLGNGLGWGGQKETYYYWESRYDEADETRYREDPEDDEEEYTPQEKYDLVLKTLKPEGYENMSLAEFNRTIHGILSDYEREEDLSYLYEMVLMELEEETCRINEKTDGDVEYLRNTIRTSMDEYYTAERALYSRKRIEPEYSASISSSREEDVYGDKVTVNMAEGYYTFTYNIADSDKLTVAGRDKFLKDVVQEVQKRVDNAGREETLDEAFLKKAVDEAGKAAGNSYIEYTGCRVDYMEQYDWE